MTVQEYSRWKPITRTTPSGKQLYVCVVCGRVAVAPDKECTDFVNRVGGHSQIIRCSEVEKQMFPNHGAPISDL